MARYALVVDARIDTVVEQEEPPSIGGHWVLCGPSAGPGWIQVEGGFVDPSAPPAVSWADQGLDPRYHWIDVGSFFDRFGAKALSITSTTDPEVRGLVTLLLPRKYVDLKRSDLPELLGILVNKAILTESEMALILWPQTVDHERHVPGMPQPI